MANLLLFPSCDLHLALTAAPRLFVRVTQVVPDAARPGRYVLNPVTTGFDFDFFAPYQKVGERFDNLPAVNTCPAAAPSPWSGSAASRTGSCRPPRSPA